MQRGRTWPALCQSPFPALFITPPPVAASAGPLSGAGGTGTVSGTPRVRHRQIPGGHPRLLPDGHPRSPAVNGNAPALRQLAGQVSTGDICKTVESVFGQTPRLSKNARLSRAARIPWKVLQSSVIGSTSAIPPWANPIDDF
nr:hypothetical protein [uncultured bacterium]